MYNVTSKDKNKINNIDFFYVEIYGYFLLLIRY